MKQFTLFLAIFVATTAILAAPSSPVGIDRGNVRSDLHYQLSQLFSRDSFAELIEMELGQTASEFLSDIDAVFKEVELRIRESVAQLDNALVRADRSMKDKIIEIQRNELEEMSRITRGFVSDLGKVLIGTPTSSIPVADLVRAILCKTLQEFVVSIHRAMEDVSEALQDTIDDILDLADMARDHDLANLLRNVGDVQLPRGRTVIAQMLVKLRNLLSFKIPMTASQSQSVVVLSTSGFGSKAAAYQAIVALSKLIPLIESSRHELIDSVGLLENGKVQRNVMDVYDSAMSSFVKDIKPVYQNIMDLRLSGCQASDIPVDLGSLSRTDNFGSNLQNEIIQVESNAKAAVANLVDAAIADGGTQAVEEITEVLDKQLESIESILMPVIQTLRPSFGKRY